MICSQAKRFFPFHSAFIFFSSLRSFPFTRLPHTSIFNSIATFHTTRRRRPFYHGRHQNKPEPIPPPDPSELSHSITKLPPRLTSQDLSKAISLQPHPLICLHLFNHASSIPRFKHDLSTYLVTIQKLGSAQLFNEFDSIVNQALATPIPSSQPLYNTIIYYYTESRKLTKAVNVFKHMKKLKDPASRPSIKTYNLLFTAMLSRGSNSYINHMYMETIRCLFRQMVDDGIEPDIFSLNSMIKGYVLSLHLNDALRIFHQMGVVYRCLPNEHSYNYIIHGLCSQGRSKNAKQLYGEMVDKGFVPSEKAYNSMVNCLAIAGEIEEAVRILWEMLQRRRMPDLITYQTVLDAIGREGKVKEAFNLLREFKERNMIDGQYYKKLLFFLEDEFGDFIKTSGCNLR